MKPADWDQCKRIFLAALDVDAEARLSLVEQECGDDVELRKRVQDMLAAAADNSSPLDVNAAERIVGNLKPAEPLIPGDVVGRYRVLRRIGQGGTSVVYLGEHAGLPSRRRFAIKVIASAFIGGHGERFERECEILAALEHPNVARILDKGMTESGWPYLVMDYIDGAPIHEYCREKNFAPPEIVRLVIECCQAVRYIHSHFVVHCDLKPSNILVDEGGSPRILDFGIARLIEPGDEARSGGSTRGVRPLTPNYASPEQLAGFALTISTDIYSLGVVLYECLATKLPFDNSEIPWPQISERLAGQKPALPSKARLASSSTREDVVCARQIRGDLDSIVLRTLEHNPTERYRSMGDLIADLNGYLAGDAVAARHSSITERLGKLVRRRRRSMAAVLACSVSIVLAAGLSLWYAQGRQRSQENLHAAELRDLVTATLTIPEEPPDSSQARAALADRLTNAIVAVSPRWHVHRELIPDLAEAQVKTADLLGNPYTVNLGRPQEAREFYERALELVKGRVEPQVANIRARAYLGLGDTYNHATVSRDADASMNWYRRALQEITPQSLRFPQTAALAHSRWASLSELLGEAANAETEYKSALALLPLDTGPQRTPALALRLFERAQMTPASSKATAYAGAIASLEPALATTKSSRVWQSTVDSHLAMGLEEMRFGRLSNAESEFNRAAAVAQQILLKDADNPPQWQKVALSLRRRAMVAAMRGQSAQSDRLRQAAAEVLRSTVPLSAVGRPGAQAVSSCPATTERFSAGYFPRVLQSGDLLIGNRELNGIPGQLLVFLPSSREVKVLAAGGYLSDVVDIVFVSQTELYVVDGHFGGGGVVRIRYDAGRWLQKPVTCGGLLNRPMSIGYSGRRLLLADTDLHSSRLIAVDADTGKQTLLSLTGFFTEPGKIVHLSGAEFYLSLYWSGEGGPAEILRFNSAIGSLALTTQYGSLDAPVALGVTPGGVLIAANRAWSGTGGYGDVFRIERGGGQKLICRNAELSRVSAIAVGSEREAWYTVANAPATEAALFRLDLLTGNTEQIMRGGKLAAPHALVSID